MAKLTIRCPDCGKQYLVSRDRLGKRMQCKIKWCAKEFVISKSQALSQDTAKRFEGIANERLAETRSQRRTELAACAGPAASFCLSAFIGIVTDALIARPLGVKPGIITVGVGAFLHNAVFKPILMEKSRRD